MSLKCLCDHIPFYIKKRAKNGNFARKNGVTGLILGTQTQLDSANNMGWVPSGHTKLLSVREKNAKYDTSKKKIRPNHISILF